METFNLFDVTPIGVALVLLGILYFVMFGRFVLPKTSRDDGASARSVHDYVQDLYGLEYIYIYIHIYIYIYELEVPKDAVSKVGPSSN